MKKNVQRIMPFLMFSMACCCIILSTVEGFAQVNSQKVCRGEFVVLELTGYSGSITVQWQLSSDATTWSSIPNATNVQHGFTAYTTEYYRAELTDPDSNRDCIPYYSDTVMLVTDTIVPTASPASGITSTSFNANWTAVAGARGYYLDVAYDVGFTLMVEDGYDAGDVTTYNESGLRCQTTYYYRVQAYYQNTDSTSCYSNAITVATDTCPTPVECTYKSVCDGNITDSRDTKTYKTVQIGTQCWMAENLNAGTMVLGTLQQTQSTDNQNTGIEKYCYEDNASNCTKHGGLYLWDEMMAYGASKTEAPGPRGICPTGWHLPVDNEWRCLEESLGGAVTAGGKLKDTTGWSSPNTGATNSSGFTVLPGGIRRSDGSFNYKGQYAYLWTATENGAADAWDRNLGYDRAQTSRSINYKALNGFSVRCLKD